MKRGRKSWTAKVSRPALERIQAAIDGGEDARAVFDRFNVQQYGISPRAFSGWCRVRRRDWAQRQETPAASETAATVDTLLASLVEVLQVELDAGRMKPGQLPGALIAVSRAKKLDFEAAVEKRAAEVHEIKLAELRKTQGMALADVQQRAQLTNEQVAEIRSKVLGL